jgi:hypothetical protein
MVSSSEATTARGVDVASECDRYLYKGGNFTPGRLIETMIAGGEASPAARSMPTEDVLNQIAEANAIDRATATSDEFPVRVVR